MLSCCCAVCRLQCARWHAPENYCAIVTYRCHFATVRRNAYAANGARVSCASGDALACVEIEEPNKAVESCRDEDGAGGIDVETRYL